MDVGLCLAKGGREFGESSLMADQTFTSEANTFDNRSDVYYHMQYFKPFNGTYRPVSAMLDSKGGEEEAGYRRIVYSKKEDVSDQLTHSRVLSELPARPGCRERQSQSRFGAPQAWELTPYPDEARALAGSPSEETYVSSAGLAAACFPPASRSPLSFYEIYADSGNHADSGVPGIRLPACARSSPLASTCCWLPFP